MKVSVLGVPRVLGAVAPPVFLLGVVTLAGLGAGAVLAVGAPPAQDAALTLLLRFMAVVKGGMVLGAVAAAVWRIRVPASASVVLAYAVATAVMAAGLWPIWTGTRVAAGALLVHGGLAAFMVMAWRDRAGWMAAWASRPRKTSPSMPALCRSRS